MAPRKPKKAVEPELPQESLAAMLGMDEYVETVLEEYKDTKYSPFDFLNEITYGKNNLILDDEIEKQYTPFIINKGLSQSKDCILWANHMNSRTHIPKFAQNLFLLGTIVKRKRYDKWSKSEDVPNLEMVMEFYNCSRTKALSALSLLTEDNLEYIKKKMFRGGMSK